MPNLPFKIGRTKTPKVAPIFATPAAKPLAVARNCVGKKIGARVNVVALGPAFINKLNRCHLSRAPKAIAGWVSAATHPVATPGAAMGLLRPMLVFLVTVRFFLVVRCLMILASNFRQIHGRLWKLHIHFFHRAGNDLRNRQIAEPLSV